MKSAVLSLLLSFALTGASVFAATQVDINSADAKTLAETLEGIGLVKAEAIVAYRNAHGPFRSIDDLAKVKGIGPHIIEDNRDNIVFGAARSNQDRRRIGSPTPLSSW